MAAIAPADGTTRNGAGPHASLVADAAATLVAEATEITPGFTNFIALATTAGAWRLLAGSADPALAARALRRVGALRPDRSYEPIIRAGARAWVIPLSADGRLVGCVVLLADHDRVVPAGEAAFVNEFARRAARLLADAVDRQRDALGARLAEAVRELPRALHAVTRDPEMLAALGASLERAIPSCNWAVLIRRTGQRDFQMAAASADVADSDPAMLAAAKQATNAGQVTVIAPRRGDVAPLGAFVAFIAPLHDARMRFVGAMVVRVPGDQGAEAVDCSGPFASISDILSVALDLAAVARETRVLQRRDAETGCLSPEHLREVTAALIDACSVGKQSGALLLIRAAPDDSSPRSDIAIAQSLRRFVDADAGDDVSIARMGASRYAIVAPDRCLRDAVSLAARLRWHLRTAAGAAPVASSVGIAMLALNGATFDAVLEAATEALDEAIEMGGDCERVAAPKLHQVAVSTGPVDAVRSIEMLRTLAEMIDKLYFAGTCHSGAVATRASDVAVRLGVPEALVSQIRLAGEFHDIGRALLTPDLFTTQVPTDAERRLVQTHVILGARLVSNTGFEDAAECIAGMHERWDGSGQPLGQAGVVIPLGARILAAANAFETVLGGHGRGDCGLRAAVTAVVGARGQSLDPQVVDSLLASLRASMDSAA